MKTIAVLNLKGGVAKTVTVVNVAAILARDYSKRVLVIDADSQCNTTEFFGADPEKGNLAEVLRHEPYDGLFAFVSIQHTNFPGVDILAGDESLMDLDLSKVENGTASAECLKQYMDYERDLEAHPHIDFVCNPYDYVLIDCPPAFNAASCAALVAADEVVIPIKLDAFSLRGMSNLMRQISNMRRINPGLKLAGLLPTMWYRSDNILEAEKQLRASKLHVFPRIRRTAKVDDMTFAQEPVIVSSPKSAAAVDYRAFVHELVNGAQMGTRDGDTSSGATRHLPHRGRQGETTGKGGAENE